jgi:hypothetical protein
MGYFLNLAAKLQKIAVKAKHIWKKGVQNKRFIPFVSQRNVRLLTERYVVSGRKMA